MRPASAAPTTVYVGSLSNLLAPGISTGFVVAPPPVFERLASLRAASDARGDVAMECAIAELFEDGELLRHMRRMRRVYAARRDALVDALRAPRLAARSNSVFPKAAWRYGRASTMRSTSPRGMQAGEREGVRFVSARPLRFPQRECAFLRLGFSYHDEAELDEAARRMARAWISLRAARVAVTSTERGAARGVIEGKLRDVPLDSVKRDSDQARRRSR